MKRLAAFLLALIMLFAAVGCAAKPAAAPAQDASESTGDASSDASSQTESTDGKKMTFAGIWIQEEENAYYYRRGMQKACDELGADLLFAISGDQSKEQELLTTYITQGVDGIAMTGVSTEGSYPLMEQLGAEVPICDFAGLEEHENILGGISVSHSSLGSALAPEAIEFIKNNLNGECKLGVITFKSQYAEPAAMRMDGFCNPLLESDEVNVEIVAEGEAWLQDQGIQVATDMLTAHPEINMLFACNAGGLCGAVLAVKNEGLAGKVFVYGVDCMQQQVDWLKSDDNILQACTAQDSTRVGYEAIYKIYNWIETQDPELKKISVIEPTVVSRTDPDGIAAYEQVIAHD